MRELRLVPAALLVWAIVLATVVTREAWLGLGLLAVAALSMLKFPGPGLTALSLGLAALSTSLVRIHTAPAAFPAAVLARIETSPTMTKTGGWITTLSVDGATVRAFLKQQPPPLGTSVVAQVTSGPADRPGVTPVVLNISELEVVAPPRGFDAWAASVKADFVVACAKHLGPASEGLLPGMVLGDTSAQSLEEKQLFLDTGLSHLTAVSGSNITILTVAAVLLAKAVTLGPRYQVGCAAITLAVFVGLVGFEPSVLRASVTGIVGLLAVLGSAQAEPAHGLSLAVIALLLYDSDLAVSYGFALSVAATAGLIALSPLLYRALARHPLGRRVPDIVLRALAVAIAADLVTMPLVAAMTGRVVLASIIANVLVAAAVAPVTILGLLAVLLPAPLEMLLLRLAEPFTWWIATVARAVAGMPKLQLGAAWALLFAGWLVWLIHKKWAHYLLAGLVLAIPEPRAAETNLESVIQLETIPKDYRAPPGVQAIIVLEPGKPSKRPHVTQDGVPILYPNRDGPVRVLRDGTQHAHRGHF
ncbi:ComEC/Rec2 family competence protein [Corynebacterium sp. H128]|uniref:ComEC/Rec2 family competence protein n=1 Tax=Corynebacterium sp. H128 TaxID=3133427 RepID=UPI003096D782